MIRWVRSFGGAVPTSLLCLMVGCASFPRNLEIEAVDPDSGYRYRNLTRDPKNTESTFVILTLSGGGTRAAALAYGAMEKLQATDIEAGSKNLLDEVDVVSSVSGGSFAAAYYAAFGRERFFAGFRPDVLDRNIQGALVRRVLAPWNWPRLLSPKFGRSDLLQNYYHRKIFGRTSYSDLPSELPFVILNASDMSTGAQFSFTQDQFDALCSQLASVDLARAVISSSAFPGGFTPLTFENYPKNQCGYQLPIWARNALDLECDFEQDPECIPDVDANPGRFGLARNVASYLDPQRRYIHLVDGGVSDNLGVRGPLNAVSTTDAVWSVLSRVNAREIDRIVVVIVDAKPRKESRRDRKASPPNLLSVLSAAASRPLANYSRESVERFRKVFEEFDDDARDFEESLELCDLVAEEGCSASSNNEDCRARVARACRSAFAADRPPHNPDVYRIHVRFEGVRDAQLRSRLEQIPTSLRLPPETIDLLIKTAHQQIEESPDFRRLIKDIS